MSRSVQNRQQQLIEFIDAHALEEFVSLYQQSLSVLKSFEHIELLLRACRCGSLEFIHNILNKDSVVNVNCRHPSTGYSPLFIAIRAKQHDIIKYLIQETQANVNWSSATIDKDKTATTCLHEALRQGDVSTVTLLLQHGATVDERHMYVVINDCFRQNLKKTSPLVLFDILIGHHPELIEETGRVGLIEFIRRRATWPSMNQSQFIVPLLTRLLNSNAIAFIDNIFFEKQATVPNTHRTQVAIVGAGPAGLMLGALLSRRGIDSVILERHSRSHVESVIRGGVLEQSTIDLLDEVGAGERLFRQSIVQRNVNFQFDGKRISVPVAEMAQGKMFVVYGQQYVLQDLIQARVDSGQRIYFDIQHVHIERHDATDNGNSPLLRFRQRGYAEDEQLHCDFIAGCDGATSQCCRQSIPSDVLHVIERSYPFSWLSILAEAVPNGTELVYANHSKHGFALQSFRSPTHSRFHLQVPLIDTLDDWPDERIWSQLELRLTPTNQAWTLTTGRILERAIFRLRSSVTSPMQYKRLFLVGDAAHVVPPTGAKGLNVAVKDARILSESFVDFYEKDRWDRLNSYTAACSSHIWQAQEYANYMTTLLHNFDISKDDSIATKDEFDQHLQQARRQSLQNSRALQYFIAEMYC